MGKVIIASLLWKPKGNVQHFSRMYDESWAEKLFAGFRRNLTVPYEFVLFTDNKYNLSEDITQIVNPDLGLNGYADCIKPYALNRRMILVGLDTIVIGNIDHLAEYTKHCKKIALPRDPFQLSRACNAVALVPDGMEHIAIDHKNENDMEWLRTKPHVFLDDIFPGEILSYKCQVKNRKDLTGVKIVYFHGLEKPHELTHLPWIKEHWRT